MGFQILLTCEHATNYIPPPYQAYFQDATELLETHRGYDIGASPLGTLLALKLQVPFHQATASRLLIDCNRSLGTASLFSEFTQNLSPLEKEEITQKYYHSYRSPLLQQLQQWVSEKQTILHLSLHSFVPVLHGEVRQTDIGLLYDPLFPSESQFCEQWQSLLKLKLPELQIDLNSPYRGDSDGFTTSNRSRFPHYLGIELEFNQKWLSTPRWKSIQDAIISSILKAIELFQKQNFPP